MTTVEKIKAKILDLAIRGKLVPQDPNDEPASELLKRIRAEKDELVKTKKVKKEKNPSAIVIGSDGRPYEKFANGKTVCIEDEIPFGLPSCWAWARLKNLSESIQYGYNAPAKVAGRIRMVRITDIQNNGILWGQVPYCDIKEADIPKYLLHAGDLLFARTGGTVGKSHLVSDVPGAAVYAGYLIRTRCTGSLSPQYAKRFMESALYWTQLRKDVIATAQPNCNGQKLGEMLIPLPPLAEQKRIASQIEELFAEVEKIAAAKNGIACTAERINKKVLDLAMRGQLVPQDASDEPADELLKRIAEARQKASAGRSRASGKDSNSIIFRGADRSAYEIRNGKTVCIDDEIPFDIPDSWAWCRLCDLGEFVGGHTPLLADKSNWEKGTILWVTSKDMKQKYISDTGNKVSRKGAKELQLLPPGSLLMVTRSGILRRTFPIAIAAKPLTINQDQRALRFHLQGIEEYVYCVLKGMETLILRDYRKTGTTVESIIWEKFTDLLIPIPPLAEQKRIVAKIEYIMSLTELIART